MRITRSILGGIVALVALAAMACAGGDGDAAATAPAQPAASAPAAVPKATAPETAAPKVAPAPAVDEPKYGGIPTWGVRRDPPTAWDTMRSTSYDTRQMGMPIWGSGNLVRKCWDDARQVCPSVAESWESDRDFTQWTFKIRENVFWHDGTPLTAEDVGFWLTLVTQGAKVGDKTRSKAGYAGNFGQVVSVDVLDGNRVRMNLGRREPYLLDRMSAPVYMIQHPRHLMQERLQNGETKIAPVDIKWIGAGPFKMVNYDKGNGSEVARYDQYWEKDEAGRALPYLDGMKYAILSNPSSFDAAFRVGRLDGGSPANSHVVTKERQANYIKDLGDKVWFLSVKNPGAVSGAMGFNLLGDGPWKDVRVRQAIQLWIDRQSAIEAVTGGFGVIGGIFNADSPFTAPDLMKWPGWNPATKEQDRAEAKKLLAAAGVPDGGFTMNMPCNTRGTWVDRCQFLQAQLREMGIGLELNMMDQGKHTSAYRTLDWDAYQIGGSFSVEIPEATEVVLGVYEKHAGGFTKHADAKLDGLFSTLNGVTSLEERTRIWREIERHVLVDQVHVVPLANPLFTIPYSARVKGRLNPSVDTTNYFDMTTVWLNE